MKETSLSCANSGIDVRERNGVLFLFYPDFLSARNLQLAMRKKPTQPYFSAAGAASIYVGQKCDPQSSDPFPHTPGSPENRPKEVADKTDPPKLLSLYLRSRRLSRKLPKHGQTETSIGERR